MSEQLHHSPFARMVALPIFIFAAVEGVCDTPLQFFGEILFLLESSFKPCERSLTRIERTGVGAYRIRPSHERTTPSYPLIGWMRFYFHFRRHGGRMRYAPTIFGGILFYLGIFSHGILTALPGELLVTSFSPPWRAYAIRPYNFWRKTFFLQIT